MALADPQSVDVGGAVSLPRTGSGINSSEYTSADGTVKLTINHSKSKGIRSVISIEKSKISADAMLPNVNTKSTHRAYVVYQGSINGWTAQERIDLIKAIPIALSATSYALVTKFVGGES